MKFAYVDDDEKEYDTLTQYITRIISDISIDYYPSEKDFLASWHKGIYDCIFLDIYLNGSSGVDLAKKIRKTDSEVRLAFCTTSNEYASESYEVNARYYLQKPFTEEKVRAMIERINLDKIRRSETVSFSDGHMLPLYNIADTEYSSHCALAHCIGDIEITLKVSQTELEKTLCAHPCFICSSKGIIVNLNEVKEFDTGLFTMKDGLRVPISRRKYKEVRQAYASFLFDRLRSDH